MYMKIQFTKNSFLMLLLFLLANLQIGTLTAQPYQSIFGSEKTVFQTFTPITCYDPTANLLGCGMTYDFTTTPDDTISFNDKIYQKMILGYRNQNREAYGYIREDTLTGRIFRYYDDLNEEFLWCDMSLDVGDTFYFPKIIDDYNPTTWKYRYDLDGFHSVVQHTDTIDGKKVIYLQGASLIGGSHSKFYNNDFPFQNLNITLKFIEGIGTIFGVLGYLNGLSIFERYLGVLLCVREDETLTYMTHEQLGCWQAMAKVSENEKEKMKVYPNPSIEALYIELPDNISTGNLIITNSIGVIVYQKDIEFTHSVNINVAHLQPGFYTISYLTNEGRLISKFVKN